MPRTAGSAVDASTQDERLARAMHRNSWQQDMLEHSAEAVKEAGWTLKSITIGKLPSEFKPA